MIIKNLKEEKYIMCAWCGKTFRKDSGFSEEFSEHQKESKNCDSYFEIDIVGKSVLPNGLNKTQVRN